MRWLIPLICLALAACSSSKPPILHLDNADISEVNFQGQTRAALSANPLAALAACKGVDGLSPDALVSYLRAMNASDKSPVSTPTAKQTPRVGQKAADKDEARAGAILQSECKRLGH